MNCDLCGVRTANLRVKWHRPEESYLVPNIKLLCRVCSRKDRCRPWRWFRVLQIMRLY